MLIRMKSIVDIGVKRYSPGDMADVDEDTARSLIALQVARYVPEFSSGPVEPMPPEKVKELHRVMETIVKPSRRVEESATLPAPEPKRKGGGLRRKG